MPRRLLKIPRRLWTMLREPKAVTTVFTAAWLVVVYIGVAALMSPPVTIEQQIGPILTYVWATLLLIGGVVGFVGCVFAPEPWHRYVERYGLAFAGVGTGIYALVVILLHLTGTGSRLVQLGFIALGALTLVLRAVLISDRMVRYWRGLHGHPL